MRKGEPRGREGDAAAPGGFVRDREVPFSLDDRRAALTALMNAHGSAIYGLCVRVLRDPALAKDVLQQVFVEAYRDLHRFEGRSSIRTWLTGIASHRCKDALKVNTRRASRFTSDERAIDAHADPAPDALARLDRTRLAEALEDCLAVLSADVRATVLLRFKSGMTYQEMAPALDAKADTLHARVARALPSLRACLEHKGWDGE